MLFQVSHRGRSRSAAGDLSAVGDDSAALRLDWRCARGFESPSSVRFGASRSAPYGGLQPLGCALGAPRSASAR